MVGNVELQALPADIKFIPPGIDMKVVRLLDAFLHLLITESAGLRRG